MDILKIAAQQFLSSSGQSGLGAGQVVGALQNLMGGGGIGDIVSKLQGQGLQQLVGSWLSDGKNEAMGADQVTSLFGADKVSAFASELNMDQDTAAKGLAGAIPSIVDKASSGGSLLESALGSPGGLGGLLGAAKALFK
ncbi:MAG: YidB family protein [Gammaproteobacteria bacterium]